MAHKKAYHGHNHMIKHLETLDKEYLKGKTLIEIGTTREIYDDQDSSMSFSKFCNKHEMNFITVDMDNENIRNILERTKKENLEITAVAQKGEDFLAEYDDEIHFIYLDAFDYYHTQHSKKRKSKYKTILNSEITNENCWKMHYDCCTHLVKKMKSDSVIVFDDILDIEKFNGKGKTAVPLLLDNGFEILDYIPNSLLMKKQ